MNTHRNYRPLEGQRALVTGANTGIGAAVAKGLAAAGAKVMINYVSGRDKAESLAEHIRAKEGEAIVFEADVSQENQVRAMFETVVKEWRSLDILVNNAGLQQDAALVNMTLAQWNDASALFTNQRLEFTCRRPPHKGD